MPANPFLRLLRVLDGSTQADLRRQIRCSSRRAKHSATLIAQPQPHAELLIQTMLVECLDRLIDCGSQHLDHLMAELIELYNTERPHSSLGHQPQSSRAPPLHAASPQNSVGCPRLLGGMLMHYYRFPQVV